ncbi:MAG: TonB-dependent receptor [Luminiphilus sp.]|nr:TonB-dependent receptor [Luminiphilus sp.]
MRRSKAHAIAALSMLPVAAIGSEDTLTEEIVVTASFTNATKSLTRAVHVLSGEDLANGGVQSLGEHIDSLVGVATADFGAVAGQPIIRGLSGTRVKVLNNGTVIRDVSGLGPDHAIDASLSDLQQIEIVRGPSALMYSNGALGGIVNVVDNTIPMTDLEGFSGFLGGEAQSVNDGEAVDLAARGRVGGLNITYSFQEQNLENYEIPDNAVLHMEEEHHEEGHDEDHHEEHGESGELANSDYEATAHRLGLSTTGEWGYVGVSYSDLSSTYGIPFHVEPPGGHGGHGEDHDDGHEEDHEGEHEGEEHHDEHGEERVYAETESETVTFRGSLNTSFGWLNSVNFLVKDTDYELSEGHMEVGHGDDHEEEEHDDHDEHGPTVFSNESTEIQVALDLSAGERVRRLVFNYAEEEMSIIGEEAFMAPVDSTETTIGFFSSDDLGFASLDLGVRFDRIERDGFLSEIHHDEDHDEHEGEHDEDHDEHEGEHDEGHHEDHHEGEMTFEPQSYKEDAFSIAAMLSRELNDYSNVSLGLSSVSKVPSAVELFMNGEHLATNRYEVGDVTLDTERADSIDLTFSFERNGWYGMASVYHNRIDNYIFLRDELEEEHEAHMDEDDHDEDHHDEEHHDDEHAEHGGLMLAEYRQRDAEFTGYEIEIGTVIELPRGALQLSLSRDEVNAEFANGEDVPRIVPARNIFSAQYTLDNFSARLLVKDVEKQNNVAPGESVTDGFTCIDAFASWSYGLNDSSRLTLSAFARNLTDEVSRNHASFVKDEVPLPGRNIGVRLQLNF